MNICPRVMCGLLLAGLGWCLVLGPPRSWTMTPGYLPGSSTSAVAFQPPLGRLAGVELIVFSRTRVRHAGSWNARSVEVLVWRRWAAVPAGLIWDDSGVRLQR